MSRTLVWLAQCIRNTKVEHEVLVGPQQPERFNRSWLRADMKLRGTGASHGGVSAYHLAIWSLIRHSWNGTV